MADPADRRRDLASRIIKDQGWDILVGGKTNAANQGGQDPFDFGASTTAMMTQHSVPAEEMPGIIEVPAIGDMIRIAPFIYEMEQDRTEPKPEGAEGDLPDGYFPTDMVTAVPELPEVEDWIDEENVSVAGAALSLTDPSRVQAERVNPTDPWDDQEKSETNTVVEDKPPSNAVTDILITETQIKQLSGVIDAAYQKVSKRTRGNFGQTDALLEDLRQARMYLHSGNEFFDEAEKLVYGVESRLIQEEKVRQWSQTGGSLISLYLIVWLCFLVFGMVTSERLISLAGDLIPAWMGAMYLPTLFGGVGGVVGALWVLIKHTTQQKDFDPIHSAWYITNPLMGLLLGMIAYLVTWGGGNVLTLISSGTANSIDLTTVSPAIYPLCLVVGFNQNVLWNLIDKFIKAIVPSDDDATG